MVFPIRHEQSKVAEKWRSTIFEAKVFGSRIVRSSAMELALHPEGLEPATL
jgi:hypothetical protein